MISLIWIKRISAEEDSWLAENLLNLDNRYEVVVVGHTNLDSKKYNFKYVPFYENDDLGLICHKKNLGIATATRKYCLVLHSDATPVNNFYDIAILKNYDENSAVCPLGIHNNSRALSWCNYHGNPRNKDMDEPADKHTYISGAAIFAQKQFFLRYPWNENLRHNKEEDVELSRRIMNSGAKLLADKDLVFTSRRSQ